MDKKKQMLSEKFEAILEHSKNELYISKISQYSLYMAKKKGIRRHIILKSTESGHAYHTEKSSRNTPDRIEIKKFDPLIKKHVTYKEEK